MLNQSKILENTRFLGTQPIDCDNTEKRSAIRKLLNGLGFATEDYIQLTMPVLQKIYNGALLGNEGLEMAAIKGCTAERAAQAINDFKSIALNGAVLPTPVTPVEQKPVEKKENTMPATKQPDMTQAMAALQAIFAAQSAGIDESAVLAIVQKEMATFTKPLPRVVEITDGAEKRKVEGLHHYLLPSLIKKAALKTNLMLVGPAGSGKTTLAHQIAIALGVDFYFNGAISSEYKLTGFIDAQGRIVSTAFRRAYEQGGLYLFDEIDASMSDALLAFNAALANGHMDFPDGVIKRHEKFYCIAAANTFGKGADRIYVGRNCLDAASLNRFAMINIDYDEKLERELAANDHWTAKVQKIRRNVAEHKIKHVVSPRASIEGAKWLANGIPESEVLEELVYQGMDIDSKRKIMI